MRTRKGTKPAPEAGPDANQVVAANFRAARELRGWTQEECASRLAAHLGAQLGKASISAIERSVETERRREFDATELVAFAATFDLPVIWFLLPPPGTAGLRLGTTEAVMGDLVPLVLGRQHQLDAIAERLAQLVGIDPTEAEETAAALADFPVGLTWAHFQRAREDALLALVEEDSTQIDRMLSELRRVLARFEDFSLRSYMAAHPRRVYREVSHGLLGERIFSEVITETSDETIGRYQRLLVALADETTAFEEVVDLGDDELRRRLAAVYDQIEDQLRRRDQRARRRPKKP